MIKLVMSFQNLYRMNSILLLILLNTNLNAQNLILNPDFSDVVVEYNYGKKVFPNNWKSFNWPFPTFFYPDKVESSDFFYRSSYAKGNGVVGLNILHPSEAIFTKLRSSLQVGQLYKIYIKLKISKISLNSNVPKLIMDKNNHKKESPLDINCIIGLITTFHDSLPDCVLGRGDHIVFFDFPKKITTNYQEWINLSTTYLATGNEKYFSIGQCSTHNYISILERYNSDTTNYNHKFAYYLLSDISVFPISGDATNGIKIFNQFSDSILFEEINTRFIVQRINFSSDNFQLNEDAKMELAKFAFFLKKHSRYKLKIIGHTDSTGSINYNQLLSEKRAKTVYSFLISQGIDKERLFWEGKGEKEPLPICSFDKNSGINRRVEFEIIKE